MSAGDGSSSPAFSSGAEDELVRAVARAPALAAPPALPKPGDRLGRFVLGARLGHGATGVVYAAHDEVLERDVAIKVLALAPAVSRARVLREARAAARIVHPGVALVHDVLDRGDLVALVLERVRGRTLREVLDADGPLAPTRAAAIVAQAARAVHAAHEAGVLHRDLKPANIMVSARGEVKLLDFGLAASLGGGDGRAAGTPGYVAPEALAGKAERASDLYALGVVLCELVGGDRAAAPKGLSRRAQRILKRTLSADTTERPRSGLELAQALEGLHAPASTPLGRWRVVRDRLVVVGLAILGMSPPRNGDLDGDRAAAPPVVPVEPVAVRAVACPPLDVELPHDRFLGAAAASVACRALREVLGGARRVAVPPAELLELGGVPSSSTPRDPFIDERARDEALARAEGRAAHTAGLLIIDGEVARTGGRHRVTLTAREGERAIASATAEGSLVEATVRAARLVSEDDALRFEVSAPDVQRPNRATEHERALSFARLALDTGGSLEEARAGLSPFVELDGETTALEVHLALALGEPRALPAAPPVDRSSDGVFATSATIHVVLGGDEVPGALAREAAARRMAAHERGTAAVQSGTMEPTTLELLRAEAFLRLLAEERDLARSLALAAAQMDPWDAPWGVLAHASYGRPEWQMLSRAHTTWMPEAADAWNVAAHVDAPSLEEKGAWLERAFVLGDHFPLYAGNYASFLLSVGRLDDARAIVARLRLGSPGQRSAAVRLSLDLAWAEGRLSGGVDDALRALPDLATLGSIESGDVAFVANLVELAMLLGRAEEVAHALFMGFVEPELPRVDRGPFARQAFAHACAYARADVAARCFDRLAALTARGYFPMRDTGEPALFIEGARAFAEGRAADAARAFRGTQAELGVRAGVASRALAAAGDGARADAIDPVRPGARSGVSMSHVRALARATQRADCARTRELAAVVEPALEGADRELAAVVEAKALLARCARR